MIIQRQVSNLDRQSLDELYRGVGSLAYDPVVLLKMVLYRCLPQHCQSCPRAA